MGRGAGLAAALAPACTAKLVCLAAGFALGWGAAFALAFEVMGKQCKAMRKADGQHKLAQYMLTRKTWK